tara:strand:+ start:457 stop:1041 length:585 start_codon:yes stop_codon:yes gene_type:complete
MNLDKRLFDILNKQKILPLINSKNLDEDIKIIESLINVNNNLKIIEITLREKNSLNNAIQLKKMFPNLIIGLGTILNIETLRNIQNNNFEFFISPSFIPEIINENIQNYIPGAETISEFNILFNKNYNVIKFFPATLSGGSKKLISIKNIFKNLFFLPTGGINIDNINDYLILENVICVGLSNINDIILYFKNK